MDLIIVLALLMLLQCVEYLPAGVSAFVRIGSYAYQGEGPRWWLQSPLPWTRSMLGARPLVVDAPDGGLQARGSSRHPLLGSVHESKPYIAGDQIRAVEARGVVVVVNGAPFVRCPSESHAEALANRLRPGEQGAVTERLAAAARDSCSVADLEASIDELHATLRPLSIATVAYGALLLAIVPSAMGAFGSEAALYWFWPGVLAAHLASFAVLVVSVRRVGLQHGRVELLLPALLYPPALLRARGDLVRNQLAPFHPATFAVQLLSHDEARAFLRRELAKGLHPRTSEVCGPIAQGELAGLRDLLAARGLVEAELLAPPAAQTASAARYCPVCLDEFTAEGERCRLCDVALADFPAALVAPVSPVAARHTALGDLGAGDP